jgi:acyl-lipid (7-3)-desaturase (Delta-4 desaturase)
MPPEAETLRQRRKVVDEDDLIDAATAPTQSSGFRVLKSVSELTGTEVCISGKVYDISTFVHPGGDSIFMFGGNDVSVQYHMIHPYHNMNGSNIHLSKMKCVGQVQNYKPE